MHTVRIPSHKLAVICGDGVDKPVLEPVALVDAHNSFAPANSATREIVERPSINNPTMYGAIVLLADHRQAGSVHSGKHDLQALRRHLQPMKTQLPFSNCLVKLLLPETTSRSNVPPSQHRALVDALFRRCKGSPPDHIRRPRFRQGHPMREDH